jgi:ribosomal protein S27AE
MEKPIKRGKCQSCGEIEWLFEDGERLICGMCKQDKQIMEATMKDLYDKKM